MDHSLVPQFALDSLLRLNNVFGMFNASESTPFYLLRIELKHAHRPIWREVEVPANIGLSELHDVIQAVMGWDDDHLHEFVFKNRRFVGLGPDFGGFGDEVEDEDDVALGEVLQRARQKLLYRYDFGDCWEHDVILKKRLGDKPFDALRCVAGEGACPLEDCGGVRGHKSICEFLEGKAEADASEYADWVPEDYDPEAFDLEEANRRLEDCVGLLDEFLEEEAEGPRHPYEGADAATLAAYRSVFEEGVELRAAEPWKSLWDQDIFCVEDPDTGRVDVISVLGAGGEVFSLHVHRGLEGLEFWRRTMLGDLPLDPDGWASLLNVLELEFVNKAEMEEPDLDLYALAGFPEPPRGRKRWMRLRRHRPRQPCWFHPAAELSELRRGTFLAQRYVALLRVAKGGADFEYDRAHEHGGGLPATLPGLRLKAGASPEVAENWELARIAIDWSQVPPPPFIFQATAFERERCGSFPMVDERWEVGAIYLSPVMTETGPVRPLLAAVFALVENAGPPEPFLSDDPDLSASESVWRVFSQYAYAREALPRQLQVTSDIAERTFAPLKRFGVSITRVERHEALDGLFAAMAQFG